MSIRQGPSSGSHALASPISAVFGALLLCITLLLLVAYVKLVRMNAEVRRARLFIMAKRINWFLLAFMIGFLSISIQSLVSVMGVALPAAATTGAAFFFLGAVLLGSLELFLIASPRPQILKANNRQRTPSKADGGVNAR